jgi:hypothetical protein
MEIIIDKQIELMAVIQTIDHYWDNLSLQFTHKKLLQCKYKENIHNYFKEYENHETIKLYKKLCNNTRDISFFINLVLCYSNLPELNTIADPKNNLKSIFEPDFPYKKFINGIKQFYEDTNFEYFFKNNQHEYEKILNDYGYMDKVKKYVNIVDNYLESDTKNYTIIISALLMGNFGIGILTNENIKFNYSIISPYDYKDDKYIFGSEPCIKGLLWHEISHLTINDLTKKYINQGNVYGKIISEDFVKLFYTNIETIINEYIIRAITIRLFEINHEEKFVEYLLQDEMEKGFKEIEAVKDYIAKNGEINNKLLKNETYIELINYVTHLLP